METPPLTPYAELEQGIPLPELDLDFIMPIIILSLVGTAIISVLFVVYLIVSVRRRRKVEQATLDMQKDIHQIRELLEQGRYTAGVTRPISSPTHPRVPDIIAQKSSVAQQNPAEDPAITHVESLETKSLT